MRNTITSYRQDLVAFNEYLNAQSINTYADVDRYTILNYLATLQAAEKAKTSVVHVVSTLRQFFFGT